MDEPVAPKDPVRKKVVVEEVVDNPAPVETTSTPEPVIPENSETETSIVETPESTVSEEPKEETSEENKTESTPESIKEESKPEETTPSKPAGNYVNPIWLIVPVIILLVAFGGGIYVYQAGIKVSEPAVEEPIIEETTEPEASPEASPSATVDKTAYTIEIKNGSGIAGEANKVKDLLEAAGFKVGKTGNAATYDYTKTEILATENVNTDYLVALGEVLNKTYEISTPETSASGSAEVVIIVGKTKIE